MFTGIITQRGEIVANKTVDSGQCLLIKTHFSDTCDPLSSGESINVNGVCLTLVEDNAGQLAFDISPETLKLTTLGQITCGIFVNLERAMLASSRFGGHYVSGHVNAIKYIQEIKPCETYVELIVGPFTLNEMRYLFPKGSLTLDGVSLTINKVTQTSITLMLVPYTLAQTTLGLLKEGQQVNVEFDYLTHIVIHQLNITQQLKNMVEI